MSIATMVEKSNAEKKLVKEDRIACGNLKQRKTVTDRMGQLAMAFV